MGGGETGLIGRVAAVSAPPPTSPRRLPCLPALLAVALMACDRGAPPPEPPPAPAAALHPVSLRPRPVARGVATGHTNRLGEPVYATCSSCHATTTPNRDTRDGTQLVQFHQGLHFAHGGLNCLSCHHAGNYDTLRRADGAAVDFADTMTLCAQCHGRQARDYDRGLHGGMSGHWDLARGPRERNHCLHCHDAHAPQFPIVQPVFPPRDRVALPRAAAAAEQHTR